MQAGLLEDRSQGDKGRNLATKSWPSVERIMTGLEQSESFEMLYVRQGLKDLKEKRSIGLLETTAGLQEATD